MDLLDVCVSEDLTLIVLGRQDDVVFELELSLSVAFQGLEVDDQIVLDGEDGVGRQPWIVLRVQLCCAALIVGMRDLEHKQRQWEVVEESVI